MKIYKIERIGDDNFAIYEAYYGFIIVAKSRARVRKLASENHCEEGKEPWLYRKYSKITRIGYPHKKYNKEQIILSDFNAG